MDPALLRESTAEVEQTTALSGGGGNTTITNNISKSTQVNVDISTTGEAGNEGTTLGRDMTSAKYLDVTSQSMTPVDMTSQTEVRRSTSGTADEVTQPQTTNLATTPSSIIQNTTPMKVTSDTVYQSPQTVTSLTSEPSEPLQVTNETTHVDTSVPRVQVPVTSETVKPDTSVSSVLSIDTSVPSELITVTRIDTFVTTEPLTVTGIDTSVPTEHLPTSNVAESMLPTTSVPGDVDTTVKDISSSRPDLQTSKVLVTLISTQTDDKTTHQNDVTTMGGDLVKTDDRNDVTTDMTSDQTVKSTSKDIIEESSTISSVTPDDEVQSSTTAGIDITTKHRDGVTTEINAGHSTTYSVPETSAAQYTTTYSVEATTSIGEVSTKHLVRETTRGDAGDRTTGGDVVPDVPPTKTDFSSQSFPETVTKDTYTTGLSYTTAAGTDTSGLVIGLSVAFSIIGLVFIIVAVLCIWKHCKTRRKKRYDDLEEEMTMYNYKTNNPSNGDNKYRNSGPHNYLKVDTIPDKAKDDNNTLKADDFSPSNGGPPGPPQARNVYFQQASDAEGTENPTYSMYSDTSMDSEPVVMRQKPAAVDGVLPHDNRQSMGPVMLHGGDKMSSAETYDLMYGGYNTFKSKGHKDRGEPLPEQEPSVEKDDVKDSDSEEEKVEEEETEEAVSPSDRSTKYSSFLAGRPVIPPVVKATPVEQPVVKVSPGEQPVTNETHAEQPVLKGTDENDNENSKDIDSTPAAPTTPVEGISFVDEREDDNTYKPLNNKLTMADELRGVIEQKNGKLNEIDV